MSKELYERMAALEGPIAELDAKLRAKQTEKDQAVQIVEGLKDEMRTLNVQRDPLAREHNQILRAIGVLEGRDNQGLGGG